MCRALITKNTVTLFTFFRLFLQSPAKDPETNRIKANFVQKDVRAGECGTELSVGGQLMEYRNNLYLFEADGAGK